MRITSTVASLSAGGLAVLSAGVVGPLWAGAAAVGLLALGLAIAREDARLASGGAVFSLLTIAWAGLAGLGPGFVLLGTVGAVLSWDAATYEIGLTEQLTADGRATRAELVHLGSTLFVVGALAAVAYAVTVFGGGSVATTATVLVLLVGVVLLAVGLEPRGAG